MRNRVSKRITALLVMLVFLVSSVPAYAYLTEDGREAEMIKLERIISSSESMVGKVETITYNLTGDAIVYDPPKEIALVVDVSGSMDLNVAGGRGTASNPSRINIMKNALKSFVSGWKGRNAKICIVPFSNYVESAPILVSMKDANCITDLNNQINALKTRVSTNIGDGMRVAYHTLNNSTNTYATKYIITMTDGEPNYYSYVSAADKNTYYTGEGIISYGRATCDSATCSLNGLDYIIAPTGIAKMILNNGSFRSFVIGFATAAELEVNLNKIGSYSGAQKVEGTNKYFYYAGKATELNHAYSDISYLISNDVPFSSAVFSELLPEGTVIDGAARPALEAEGYIINDKYVDAEGKVRTQISRSLSGKITLTRKYPDAVASPKNLVYQLKPFSFTIRIKFTTLGTKTFKKEDGKINYDDPFENRAYYANCTNDHIINVGIPVSGLDNTHTVVMVDQAEAHGRITANVTPSAAYIKIKKWEVIESVDEKGMPAGPTDVIGISSPSPADELNSIRIVEGRKAGKAVVEAESEGRTLEGATSKGKSYIYVVDGVVGAVSANKGDVKDLNDVKCYRKIIPVTNTAEVKPEFMTFGNWRLENPLDSKYIDVEFNLATKKATGIIKILDKIDTDVKMLADVKYDVPAAGIHLSKTVSFKVTAGILVEGVSVDGAVLMAGSSKSLNAMVTPEDAYNRKIAGWSLSDGLAANGNVADVDKIVDMQTAADPLNFNSVRMIKALKAGTVKVRAETAGIGSDGNTKIAEAQIYVTDAKCQTGKTIMLWCSDKITAEGIIPDSLKNMEKGKIVFTYMSSNPSCLSVKASEINSECELIALAIPSDGRPVPVVITAEYYKDDKPTGIQKTITCSVTIEKSKVDIN